MSVSRNDFQQELDEQTMKESRENDVDTPAKLKKGLKESIWTHLMTSMVMLNTLKLRGSCFILCLSVMHITMMKIAK